LPPKELEKASAAEQGKEAPFADLDSLEAEMAKLLGRKN
jgi:hypothetical protein